MHQSKRSRQACDDHHFSSRDAQIRFDGMKWWMIISYPNGHYTWSGLGWVGCQREGWALSEYSCRFTSREAALAHAEKAELRIIHGEFVVH